MKVNDLMLWLLHASAAEWTAELEAAQYHEQKALREGKAQTAAFWRDVIQVLERLRGVLDER